MATAFRRNVGLRETSKSTQVADNDVARLMYYLRSVSLSCGLDIIMDDLVDFKNYARLSSRRADQVFEAAFQYSPDEFHKKTIFLDDSGALCDESWNKFYEVTQATEFMHLQSEVLISGKTTQVSKIMVFRQEWLDYYYLKPMQRNVDRLHRAIIASQTKHCEHCAGNAGKCVCKICPRTSASKCSRTLSLTSLIGALAVNLDEARQAKVDHCSHCKGLDAPCGCESGCARPETSTCQIIHKNVVCDACGTHNISGPRFKCAECSSFDLCKTCYHSDRHGEHAFFQIDRMGCEPVRRMPRIPPKHRPTVATAASSSALATHKGFFYLSMTPAQLKAYLNENGVSYDDCFEKQDLQRRAWECHADSLGTSDLVAFMAENGISAPASECRSVAGRRECLKRAFRAPRRPDEPKPAPRSKQTTSFQSGQRVELHGLRASHMNGKWGTVKEPETSDSNRALVAVDGVESAMLIKYENLKASPTAAYLD